MKRTMDARRFFETEIPCSEDEFIDRLVKAGDTYDTLVRIYRIMTRRYTHIRRFVHEEDRFPRLDELLGYSEARGSPPETSGFLIESTKKIASTLYRNGFVTPFFLVNLHKEGIPIGSSIFMINLMDGMENIYANHEEMRSIRKALESIAETNRKTLRLHEDYHGRFEPVDSFLLERGGSHLIRMHFGSRGHSH